MVKVISPRLEEKLVCKEDKCLFVYPEKRLILVNYPEYLKIAENIARKLENREPYEYTLIKCYD